MLLDAGMDEVVLSILEIFRTERGRVLNYVERDCL